MRTVKGALPGIDKRVTLSPMAQWAKDRIESKLAARPPEIDWRVVEIQLQQRRLQWEQEQAQLNPREQRRRAPWLLRLCRWLGLAD